MYLSYIEGHTRFFIVLLSLVDVYPGFTKSPIDIFGTGLNNLLGFDLLHTRWYALQQDRKVMVQ